MFPLGLKSEAFDTVPTVLPQLQQTRIMASPMINWLPASRTR